MDKKKKTAIILAVVIVAAAATYFGVTHFLNKDIEIQQKELDMLQQETVETKSGQVIETKLYEFENKEFFVKVPVDFTQMSQEVMAKKYPNGNPPSYAFTNENATINVVFSITEDSLPDDQIETLIETMADQLSVDDEKPKTSITKKSGHVIGTLEMITPAVDTNIYNKMAVFSIDGKMRVVSFNCTEELKDEWKPVGDFIIESLHFPVE